MLQDKIIQYTEKINAFVTEKADELEQFRIKYLGSKGIIKEIFEEFKTVSTDEKRSLGKVLNEFKQLAESKYQTLKESTEGAGVKAEELAIDMTLPGEGFEIGSRHPLALVRREIVEIFAKLGFTVAEGPEIEDDWHNFSALNFPEEHPARDMQDTFFIKKGGEKGDIALRTHTSSVQVRFRPSYFPFTEPSAEMDISCTICKGAGCNMCKHSGWVEILGCGMVDPNVLENCGIDSKKYSGFAFGMGIERITNLKYVIKDLRLFSENDVRFLKQYKSALI
ncbi:MAG: phenylalanine--tRNA ligase subunit alpha [Flavobacterium sp.]|nr:MAG: phenylalanine--tRNA ligase subunit alpha [Flavobacterium sp.]